MKLIFGSISLKMHNAVMKIIASGKYLDVTDYLRNIIRKDLESRGVSLYQNF